MAFKPRIIEGNLITYPQFAEILDRNQTTENVQQTMDKVTKTSPGKRNHIIVQKPKYERLDTELPMGTLQPHPKKRGFVAVHEGFPQALVDEGMDKQEALLLAASNVIAYGALLGWVRNLRDSQKQAAERTAVRSQMLPKYNSLWSIDSYDPRYGMQSMHVVIHRAAARIALDSAGIRDFDPSSRPPFPVHIAALADPFTASQVDQLHAIVGN